jgi:hypothetical protein
MLGSTPLNVEAVEYKAQTAETSFWTDQTSAQRNSDNKLAAKSICKVISCYSVIMLRTLTYSVWSRPVGARRSLGATCGDMACGHICVHFGSTTTLSLPQLDPYALQLKLSASIYCCVKFAACPAPLI